MKAKEFREMSVEELNAELLKLAKQELLLKMVVISLELRLY